MGTATLEQPAKLAMNAEAAKTVAQAVAGHDAVLEPKLDGWRLLTVVEDDDRVRLYTRTGNEVTAKAPLIVKELARVLPAGTVLDGEAVAFKVVDEKRVQHSGIVGSILGSGDAKAAAASVALTYVVFDLLSHRGLDARRLPFGKRRELLESLFEIAEFESQVRLIPQLPATDENHEALLALGYEGSVVKWLDAPYRSGRRGSGFFKLKGTATEDVIVTDFKPGENSFEGLVGAIVFSQYIGDELVERGRCSGMDMATRVDMTKHPEKWLGEVVEIAHMGVMPSGALRHPQYKRMRLDKPAAECLWLPGEGGRGPRASDGFRAAKRSGRGSDA